MAKKRRPTHPGIILEEHYIKPMGLYKCDLAEAAGIARNTLYRILNGQSRITADMAVRLSKVLKTSPELWSNLQQKYDIWEAEHDEDLCSENIKPIVFAAASAC